MNKSSLKTQKAIALAYMQLKESHPEIKPSVKEICALADVNKTTFYRYFVNVDALLNSIIEATVNRIFVKDLVVEDLLERPEEYFAQVLPRIAENRRSIDSLMRDNPDFFISEAESYLRKKLQQATSNKYDNVLMTFIAGGAAHFFITEHYLEEKSLLKLCRIIKTLTAMEL